MKIIKKITFIVIIITIVIVVLGISFNKFSDNSTNIANIIGTPSTGRTILVSEYVLLTEKTLGAYFKYLREGKVESAYNLLTPEYKSVVSSGDYASEMQKLDFTNYSIQSVSMRTTNMYEIIVRLSDNTLHNFLVILRKDTFAIVPEPFLEYVNVNNEIKKDKVTYKLLGYEVDLEKCIFDLEIINDKSEKVIISDARMEATNGSSMSANNADFEIEPNSSKNVSIEFETNIDFPKTFEIERDAGNKLRIYTFDL